MRTRMRSVLLATVLVASVVGAATAPAAAQPAPDAIQDDADHDVQSDVNETSADDDTAEDQGGIGHQISVFVHALVGIDSGQSNVQETPSDPTENETDSDDETAAGDDAVTVITYAVANESVTVDEPVTVTATVENAGENETTTGVTLVVDGEVVETRNVSVAANATETVTFETTFDAAGEFALAVGDSEPTTVTVAAPTPGVGGLEGTVTDAETDEPVANASVDVTENVTATTGPNGTYDLADVPAGTYNVTVAAEGYDSVTEEVAVEANETATHDVALEASADEESAPTASDLDVVLDGAPDGLQAYEVTVALSEDANASIGEVESDLTASSRLQVTDRSEDAITFRAADLGDAIGSFEDDRVLATVALNGTITADEADLTVHRLTDDAGEEMNESRVSLVLDGPLFEAPLPGSAGEAPPTDVDGDGLYEDVDGDGDADFDDAIALAFVDGDAMTDDQRAALDFDQNGEFAFADAVELAFQV